MAKYTQLFSEWLEDGGGLPSVFDNIEGFGDLFIAHFCDHEIGFETPALFAMKFNAAAELWIPVYKDRIDSLQELYKKLENPTKTRIKTGEILRKYGEITTGRTELPAVNIAAEDREDLTGFSDPASVNTDKEHTDSEAYNNVTDTESGLTPSEALNQIETLAGNIRNLKNELLSRFNNIFMQVY